MPKKQLFKSKEELNKMTIQELKLYLIFLKTFQTEKANDFQIGLYELSRWTGERMLKELERLKIIENVKKEEYEKAWQLKEQLIKKLNDSVKEFSEIFRNAEVHIKDANEVIGKKAKILD